MTLTTKQIKLTLAGAATFLAFLAPSLAFADETVTYTVKPGDTLSEIAEKYNTTVEKLAEKNKIEDIHLIFVDQVLVIEGTAPSTATVTDAASATTYEAPAATEETSEATTYEEVAETTTYEAPAAPVAEESYTAPASTVSGSEAEAKEWIAQKESGGSYTATNGRYIGRYQLTDSYLNGDYSAENQERVADAYVAGRYGSWAAAKNFWLNNGWY